MLIEFTRQINKIESRMWELEEKGQTTDPEYYRLTGARAVAYDLKSFFEKQNGDGKCHHVEKHIYREDETKP